MFLLEGCNCRIGFLVSALNKSTQWSVVFKIDYEQISVFVFSFFLENVLNLLMTHFLSI